MSKKVFCIGELLIDFVAENQGSDLSAARQFTRKAGGAPANVACAIAKLGGNSSFVGAVGMDPFGTYLLEELEANGVDTTLAQRVPVFTTLAFVSLAEDGERDFVFSRGADRELLFDRRVVSGIPGQLVHFGAATSFLGGPLQDTYEEYFKRSVGSQSFISFDPNFRIDLWRGNEANFIESCLPFIARSHLCKFSLEEAQMLSGEQSIDSAVDQLHSLGTPAIAVTLGSKGTYISSPGIRQIVPSVEVTSVDTTGAGDAFIGCLLAQISESVNPHEVLDQGESLLKMVELANKAGAYTTTNFGAIPSLPDRSQIGM